MQVFASGAANAINSSGEIVGDSANGHAVIWQSATGMYSFHGIQDLNSLIPYNSGWTLTNATGVNNSGQIVGFGTNSSGDRDAYFWQSGGPVQDLGGGYPNSINNSGQVVGGLGPGISHYPYLWQNGIGIQNLNSLIPTSSRWTLTNATGINDNGLIVGYGTNPSGQTDAFLLTPAATIALANAANAAIITGGTGTLGTQPGRPAPDILANR